MTTTGLKITATVCTLILPLGGCAATVDAANERGGIISHVRVSNLNSTTADALKLADEHCAKFHRVARVGQLNAALQTLTFECVEP